MTKEYDIYDISYGYAVYKQTVKKEISAKLICRSNNRDGKHKYMYLSRDYE